MSEHPEGIAADPPRRWFRWPPLNLEAGLSGSVLAASVAVGASGQDGTALAFDPRGDWIRVAGGAHACRDRGVRPRRLAGGSHHAPAPGRSQALVGERLNIQPEGGYARPTLQRCARSCR